MYTNAGAVINAGVVKDKLYHILSKENFVFFFFLFHQPVSFREIYICRGEISEQTINPKKS